jgi:hypothetical protein
VINRHIYRNKLQNLAYVAVIMASKPIVNT